MKLFNVRQLVALDIALHGNKFILVEFAFGTLFPFFLIYFLKSPLIVNLYVLSIGINYLPLLIYALYLVRKHSAKIESKSVYNKKDITNLSIKQFVIFIPFSILLLSAYQEIKKLVKILH